MKLDIGRGERWALGSAVAYTLVNLTLRAAAPQIDPYVGSWLRQVPLTLLAWVIILAERRPEVRPHHPAFLGWRLVAALLAGGCISFLIGNVFYFKALSDSGLGISVNAAQGASIVAGIGLAWLALRERPGRGQVVGAAVIALGLVAIAAAQGGATNGEWALGLVFALLAGASYATSNLVTRMVQRVRPMLFVVLAGTTLGGLVPLTVVVLARAGWDPAHVLGSTGAGSVAAVLIAGCANALALICLTQAMRYTTVARVATVSAAQIVFSFVGSVLLFGEAGSPGMILGVVFVVGGVVIAQVDRTRGPSRAGPAPGPPAPPAAARES